MEEIYLTDVISVKQLQTLQNSFSKLTGLAALTTDIDGKPVTKGSNFTKYCMEYTRKSDVGCERCKQCDIEGAKTTLKTGRATTYVCHSGLIDFAAPIMVEDTLIGSFIGGQVLSEKPDEDKIRAIAKEIGVPFEEYWEALKDVPIMPKKQIDEAADFLFETANVLSDIAYAKYRAIENQKETERVANMKTDFLANMSHEIRTPMNAVIGMAEMALRENLPPAARDYIAQIKSSGNALLSIINDILDFSKIESGKMDLVLEDYDPLSVMHDLASVLMTRIQDKDVELIGTINPDMPIGLYGDILRIRQIIINIANNAIKFTQHGHVWVDVDFEKVSDDMANIFIAVHDTGIGIKKEDIGKLFDSFQQLDSKRNRNIEGTGLGLAITARLLGLMNGTIRVSSVYGEGSTFSIMIPQKITNWEPSITVNDKENKAVIGYWKGIDGTKQFYDSLDRFGIDSYELETLDSMQELESANEAKLKDKDIFLFTTDKIYENEMQEFVTSHPEIQFIVVCDFYSKIEGGQANVRFIKKPFSNLGIATALNNEESLRNDEGSLEFDFIAPDAKILIVDDNDINLIVAEGLLEPLKMNITKANSGKKALSYLDEESFDIVFMDHMMPELDGVEVTHIIRRMHPELKDMPIIALTANAVGEAKKMFLEEGMNDFVAKPIEVRNLISKIRQWLPKEMIKKHGSVEEINASVDKSNSASVLSGVRFLGDLDVAAALAMIGSEKLYLTILEKYYSAIATKADLIKKLEVADDISSYTIEVHALKSASRQIGATALSEMAAELEAYGHAGNADAIHEKTDALIEKYLGYIDVFKPLFEKKKDIPEKKQVASADILNPIFEKMTDAAEELDMDALEDAVSQLEKYEYAGEEMECFEAIKEAVSNYDADTCEAVIATWKGLIG